MSVACGVECVVFLGFARWAWKRLAYVGSYDSENWPRISTADEFDPIPRISRVILAIYRPKLTTIDPAGTIIKRTHYDETLGHCPPYLIYVDHDHREIILGIRGLNLIKESDYQVLIDNRLGMQMFDGGYVHHGLLKAAVWLLNREADTIRKLLAENGPEYKLVVAGHSLGSGIAALMAIIIVKHRDRFGGIPRSGVKCYAFAPARCMSLNLAVKYADVINSVVLQDDFLPRTTTPLEHIFGSIFCFPCLLVLACLKDTFIPSSRKLKDPRRLYAPGRIYHIVERKLCRCGRLPPEVRTAIPVEGRFEHIVLSCNTTSDHAILWIEREAGKALQKLKESGETMTPPPQQKMERKQTLEKEHKDALERMVSLNVPHAEPQPEDEREALPLSRSKTQRPAQSESKPDGRPNWDNLVTKLFARDESGGFVLQKRGQQ